MVLPTEPGISYSTTKAVSASIVAVVTPLTMAATPPKRMSIDDEIAAPLSCAFPYKSMMPPSELSHTEALLSRVRGRSILRSSHAARSGGLGLVLWQPFFDREHDSFRQHELGRGRCQPRDQFRNSFRREYPCW